MPGLIHLLLIGFSWSIFATNASPHETRYDYNSHIPSAVLKNGSVNGVRCSEYNQDLFLGVPYAQPPVGQLRFKNPQSLNTSFAAPLSADRYPLDCVGYGENVTTSEDCLYLNVIRPSHHEHLSLPVAVWIFGGGLRGGGAAGLTCVHITHTLKLTK